MKVQGFCIFGVEKTDLLVVLAIKLERDEYTGNSIITGCAYLHLSNQRMGSWFGLAMSVAILLREGCVV